MKNSWIRVVYYYLFALVGLVLIVIAGVNLINLGLKMTIFQQADQDTYSYDRMPPKAEFVNDNQIDQQTTADDLNLSTAQRAEINNWLNDYRAWQEKEAKIDPLTARRQREASTAIAMLIVGIPLFLFHFWVIRKEKIGLA